MQLTEKNFVLLSEKELKHTTASLVGYHRHIQKVQQKGGYEFDEGSVNLTSDSNLLKEVQILVKKKKTSGLKYVVVVGIGGSNLGTMAVYDALKGKLDQLDSKRFPKVVFVDTVSPLLLQQTQEILKQIKHKKEIIINVISKSGATTETMVNFEVLYHELSKKISGLTERVVVTTDHGSDLWNMAKERKFALLEIPKKVGGRYSVFSPVGLFPLLCADIKITKLLQGARDFCLESTKNKVEKSVAAQSASLLYLQYKAGNIINDNFFFNPELESLGKWYRQLMGESIGKEYALEGKEVRVGITPTVSIGSTDLHSMAQLYFGGPRNKFFTLVYAPAKTSPRVPGKLHLAGVVEGIKGKKVSDIMTAIYEGVKISFQKNKIPFAEIQLSELSEYSLGMFMQFKMLEIMYLAQLFQVNAFDQPNVEEYKQVTKTLLH
jgi:glucose-6-phosphate isomerase